MTHTLHDKCLALAGIFQAAELVQQVARQGSADNEAMQASIGSLYIVNAPSVDDIFGSSARLCCGLASVVRHLEGRPPGSRLEVTRYAITLMQLAGKAMKTPAIMTRLQDGIEQASGQAEYFSHTHENLIAALAELYKETISSLSPRIMVQGDPGLLADPGKANMIRALLLAGIRAAILWRQCGGGRFYLLFSRKALAAHARELLAAHACPQHSDD